MAGRANKYGAKKTIVDGVVFASKREAERFSELKLLLAAGEISELVLQPEFLLIPSRRRPDGVLERAAKYRADFSYVDKTGERVVEDVKSVATQTVDYVLRRKLMLSVHGIAVREVTNAR